MGVALHAYRPLAAEPVLNRSVTADRRLAAPTTIFAGSRGTSPVLAVIIDLALYAAILAAFTLVPPLFSISPTIGVYVAQAAILGFAVFDLLRHGRSPGHRILGLRTVDSRTGLPPTLRTIGRGRTRTVSLRGRRDPSLITPDMNLAIPQQQHQWNRTAAHGDALATALTFDSGLSFTLLGPTVLGRYPALVDGADHLLQIPDLTRSISKVHALLEPKVGMVQVTDLGSVNGTAVAPPDGTAVRLAPHVPTEVPAGSRIEFGSRAATISLGATPPPSMQEEER